VSEADLEIVRRAYEIYERRDAEALQALCTEDCEVHTVIEGRVEPQPFRGREGVAEWIDNENQVWSSLDIVKLEPRDLGDGRVFTTVVVRLRGRESGIELDLPVWSVLEIRDGLVHSLESYPDRAEALEAAGLSE